MNSINQILLDAILLQEDQRLTLVNRLLRLSEPKASDEVRHAWDTTIRDRIDRYDRGEISSRPADADLRLCRFFGLSNGYWLRAQAGHDTEVAERTLNDVIIKIRPWSGYIAQPIT